jgi:hypothetical protein
MVDYCVGSTVAKGLNRELHRKVSATTTLEHGFSMRADDDDLVAATKPEKRILLTADPNTITPTKYKPCKHGGIINMDDLPPPDEAISRVRAFCKTGERNMALARNHFTYLRKTGATIITHTGPVEVQF